MRISTLKRHLPRSMKKQVGASAIEYAVLAGLVALLLVGVLGSNGALSTAMDSAFGKITTAIESITPEGGSET